MDQPATGTFVAKPLIGREGTVAHVVAQLAQHRCLTVVGVGGIGKTRVAIEAARRLGESLDDGSCFVDLSMLSDPSLLAAAVGAALAAGTDMTAAGERDFDALCSLLRDKRLLVVMDNCEHLIEETAYMAEALLLAPGVRVLATSREPLRARGEVVHRIAPLSCCPVDEPSPGAVQALGFGAVQLFVERAGPALHWEEADAALIDGVCDLCRRLDGMPLAIELAAAQVRVVGVQEVFSRLGADLLTLADPDGGPLVRHRTMQATLDWSHSLLTHEEQVVLRRLSVFRGAFSLESGVRVAADGVLGEDRAGLALMSLASKSMLAADASSGRLLHRLLETTRDYALARLVAAGERAATRARHAVECCAILAQAEEQWLDQTPAAWIAAHRGITDDVRAGIDWALAEDGDASLGARLVLAAVPLAGRLSLQREFVGRLRKALQRHCAHATAPGPMEFRLTSALAELLTFAYGHEMAAPVYERLGELAQHGSDPQDQLAAMVGVWANSHFLGNYGVMHKAAEQLQARAQANREPSEELFSHRAMAYALHYAGDHAGASVSAHRALAHPLGQYPAGYLLQTMIDREVGMRMILSRTLWISGQPDQAVEVAEEAMRRAEGDRPAALCAALAIAACPIALWRGDGARARAMTVRLRQHATHHGMAFWLSWAGHYDKVLALREALPPGTNMAGLEHPRGNDAVEKDMLATLDDRGVDEATIARSERGVVGWCAPEVLRAHAVATWRSSGATQASGARAVLERSLALARFQGALSWELRAATSLAQLHSHTGRTDLALSVLEPIYQRIREGEGTMDLLAARTHLERCSRQAF